MALIRDLVCKPRPTIIQLINKEIDGLNLKILKNLTIKFDPFREDVQHIRDFSYMIYDRNARVSNPKLLIKTQILTDRSEQTLNFELTNGQRFIFKCANLEVLDIFKLINQHITPLSPVEKADTATKVEKKKKK